MGLGSEELTNGDFSDGETGWSVGDLWSIAGGAATFVYDDEGVDPLLITDDFITGLVEDATYLVALDISGFSGSASFKADVVFGESDVGELSGNGHYEIETIALSSSLYFHIAYVGSPDNGDTFTIDNISIKQVLPGCVNAQAFEMLYEQ